MKRILLLLTVFSVIFASELIPFNKVKNLAQKFVADQYGNYKLDEVVTYYGLDNQPNAYAMIFKNGDNRIVNIVMGARWTSSPIGEISFTLPRYRAVYERLFNKAREQFRAEPQRTKLYYFGPGEEYCGFRYKEKELLINSGTFRVVDKKDLASRIVPDKRLESLTREKWQRYFNTPSFAVRQDSGYIPGVPFQDWVYGCCPTSASMIFGYWDSRGYGRLVDFYFTRYDPPYGQWKECVNVAKELALAMYTDSMTGGTYISNIRPGMITVANSINGYSCSSSTSPQGGSWNQWVFSWIKSEIDGGRPFVWAVTYYYYGSQFINHCLTGVGYLIELPDTFVQVHNTWGWSGEPYWALWTYYQGTYSTDYVVTFVPGGSVNDNVFLDFPRGGFVFKNLKYWIRWTTQGSNIDHLKLWYSIGRQASSYDSLNWILIDANASNTGKYLWVAPNIDSSLRVNIAGLSSTNQRLAADGSFDKTSCVFPEHTSNLELVGHFGSPNLAEGAVISGNYAYIVNGTDGLVVADISDSTLPDEVTKVSLPGNNIAISLSGSYLYLADQEDTLRVIDMSNPTNPTQVGKLALSVDQPRGICVAGNYAYIACRASGIVIVDVTTPSSPLLKGSYDTPGQAYDVLVFDTLAYVADGTRGLRILNVSDPSNPVEIGFYDTNGVTQGLALSNNLIYLAEGGTGIKVFDISDPTNPQQLGTLDTPGSAKKVLISDSLYVADGSGGVRVIDVSDSSNPTEVGYMESFGNAVNLAHRGHMLYLVDEADGLYLIREHLTGVEAYKVRNPFSYFTVSSPQRNLLKLSFCLNSSGNTVLNLYDACGRLIKSIQKSLKAGTYDFTLSPENSGVYFIQLCKDNRAVVRKAVFIK